jgi:RNA polymerase sigma-70 factor (ECF subfamily)
MGPMMSDENDHMTHSEELTVLWTRAQPVVSAYLAASIRDFHDVEDVLQDTAAAVARDFAKWDRDHAFNAWCIGIAKHKAVDYHRRHARDRHLFDMDVLSKLESAYEVVGPEQSELKGALDQCMKRVQGRARYMLELRYKRDLLPSKIAEKVGMTANAVTVALHRIRHALADCVKKKLGMDGGDA